MANGDAFSLQNPSLLQTNAFVNGKFVPANNGSTFDVLDPASGSHIATVADCGSAETQVAIEAAHAVMQKTSTGSGSSAWATMLAKERASILRKWADLMIANTEDLAQIMTLEVGTAHPWMDESMYGQWNACQCQVMVKLTPMSICISSPTLSLQNGRNADSCFRFHAHLW